ncbi:indolepyruvate ferredoxin oxidoreductase [Aeromicrobium choanae]|uniref:Indolepyruvate ferredoxin oxidoreductase n=2 Tax=Aeromicrobium choanae TaxID=1736691 RepID=A0A1T4YWX5_9ACTN|nr:indolepyruvate ferredoxin oxidoreductase [Aeromicrobium choanae]
MKLSDRYTVEDGTVFMSGLQALVRLPLDVARHDRRQGRRTAGLVSGYEGSPLAGYDLELSRQQKLLDEADVQFKPGLNEELAANIVQGSQLAGNAPDRTNDGIVGYWYGKAPGLDRASDALRHANLGGAHREGGAVAIVGDDSIAKSSTVPSSSEMAIAELGMPVLVPADPAECLELGLHAVTLSRFSGLWTGLKIATNVADGTASTTVSSDFEPVFPSSRIAGRDFTHTVSARFLQPTLSELERSLFNERIELARRYVVANGINRTEGAGDGAVVGIVAAGPTYRDVRQALAGLGLDDEDLEAKGIRLLKLGAVHPIDADQVKEFALGLCEVIVVEEKRSFIESALKEILYGHIEAPSVSGKKTLTGLPLFRADADLTPEIIADVLRVRLAEHVTLPEVDFELTTRPRRRARIALPLLSANRTPYFCSGCPHNRSTKVPEGSLVGAGIGCSGMVSLMPEERVGDVIGMTQMGGEGATWIGMAPFVESGHLFQNMGDGTFHHSGSLAIRGAVASGANITYKLLYNSAVAMTGGQEAVGLMTVDEIVSELLAEGVAKVVITTEEPRRYRRRRLPRGVDVRHRDRLMETQEELSRTSGVTVLINDQECATELRRKRKRKIIDAPPTRAFINQRVCEGCGDCGDKSNCLSVQPVPTALGRKTKIHQASCNIDLSCLDGDCPSFLTVSPGGSKVKREVPAISAEVLPEPERVVSSDSFEMRITGIGGTGVVTVSQIVATAAQIDGRFVRGLDQTGLAQKGGAVVSDVKLTNGPVDRANKIASGQADLYLGCDVLVAAQENYLGVAREDRTVAIVSTAEVPTGAMVTDTTVSFPEAESTVGRIQQVTRAADSQFVDARALTLDLFDDDQYANVFLLGVAYQTGALPVRSQSLETALELNGVAVERNVQAFRRGRQFVADQNGLLADLVADHGETELAPVSDEVRSLVTAAGFPVGGPDTELVTSRAADLESYQSLAYARRYIDVVAAVRERESQVAPGSTALVLAVAQHLHKLMAYKDEYEVARLSIDPALQAALEAEFGPGAKAQYRIHPPVFRALGMKSKLSLGAWFKPVFHVLYAMRRLRGTAFDPFGIAKLRRIERGLREEYIELVDRLSRDLPDLGVERASEIAALPDLVRGYEHIKMRNVELYRERVAAALESGHDTPTTVNA